MSIDFSHHSQKSRIFAAELPIGVPYLLAQIERQAEIKPFAPDTDNADTGNRVPQHSSIDLKFSINH
jgi:hypothetical protein